MIDIHNIDVIEFLRNSKQKFHFALYDPPYEIAFTNKSWDNSGIVFSPEYNKLLFDAMLPGAFVVCYGHARVFHRVMVALEDAGFIVHKSIMAWAYSSGQPQGAPNIIKNIDSRFSKEYGGFCDCEGSTYTTRNDVGIIDERFNDSALDVAFCDSCGKPKREIIKEIQWGKTSGKKSIGGSGFGNDNKQIIAKPVVFESTILKDYTYGLSSFKPMVEPIILVQKPFENDDAVSSIARYGTGVVNVHDTTYTNRWPGNFVAIHDLGCEFDDSSNSWVCVDTCELHQEYLRDNTFYDKYLTFSYSKQDLINNVDKFIVQSKPNKNERHGYAANPHPTIKPIDLNTYLGKLFLPPADYAEAIAFAPYSGSGSEVIGLSKAGWNNIVGVELGEDYATYSQGRIQHFTGKSCNLHVY